MKHELFICLEKQKVALDVAKERFYNELAEDRKLKRELQESYQTKKLEYIGKGINMLEKWLEKK